MKTTTMELSQNKPLASLQIKAWLDGFSETQLIKQGWRRESLREALAAHPYMYLMVSGQTAAVILYHQPSIDIAEILFLATQTSLQNQGFMRQLLEFFRASLGSAHKIWLECREDNMSARTLYLHFGFKEAGRRIGYYKDGTAAILFDYYSL
jgi:[ribosomal protein S18]-alanine N-acetyltransferase